MSKNRSALALRTLWRCAIAAAIMFTAAPAMGENYPQRPVRMILGIAPGGGTDTVARMLAQQLTDTFGQPFIVDNRPGAGGGIAVGLVRRAEADGYTLLFNSSAFLTNQLLYKVDYDTLRDLAPVTMATQNAYVLGVQSGVEAKTLQEFVALARKKPGQFNYASAGRGSLIHLTGELFKGAANIDMVHVPYKGMSLAFADILTGRVHVAISSVHSMLPHIKAGRIRALGVTSRAPLEALPGVPTIESAGFPGFEVMQWYGMLAPAKAPAEIRQRLAQEVHRALSQPDVKAKLRHSGTEPVGNTPQAFHEQLKIEIARWTKTIAAAGLRQD